MTFLSLEEELAACRAAFVGVPVGYLVKWCHHKVPVESLIEPAENRIDYIMTAKPAHEQLLRLRAFRPLEDKFVTTELAKTRAELDKAYAEYNKACGEWDKACGEWDKAGGEWDKAGGEHNKA